MSRRGYAALRGVNEGTVRKAILAGKIVPTVDGLVDRDQADRDWLRWSVKVTGRGTEDNGGTRTAYDLDDDWVRRTLAENSSDDRVVRLLEELKREIAALRRDLLTDPSYIPGLAELKREIGGVNFKLGVVFHQLVRAIEGKGVNISAEAFPPETRRAGGL